MDIDKNYLILGIILAMIVAVILAAIYLKSPCKSGIQILPMSCPGMNDERYKNSASGACLLDCDQRGDQCYLKCGSNDDCISNCYNEKAQCYMKCLKNNQETFVIESEVMYPGCRSC